ADALEPVDGLAHLPDRAPLEREAADVDHRLVAVVERVQAVRAVEPEASLRRAEDGDPPATGMGERDEAPEQLLEAFGRPDGIARDDRDAADDLVGEEGALVLAEEVGLVGAEDERRERVGAPGGDEGAGELALAGLLAQPVAPGREPRREQPRGAGEGDEEDGGREPVAEGAGEVRGAAEAQSEG